MDKNKQICEACDGTGQILNHPAPVRTDASYGVTCSACFGKGWYKSINASNGQERRYLPPEVLRFRANHAQSTTLRRMKIKQYGLFVYKGRLHYANPTHSTKTGVADG